MQRIFVRQRYVGRRCFVLLDRGYGAGLQFPDRREDRRSSAVVRIESECLIDEAKIVAGGMKHARHAREFGNNGRRSVSGGAGRVGNQHFE
ncbi:hypothetical protein CWD92_06625 [Burkholderia thailandensis]|nr:hypothetical protein CWD92_06625 [Burkholderia thailandensis]